MSYFLLAMAFSIPAQTVSSFFHPAASSMEGLEGDCLAFTVAEAVRTWITEGLWMEIFVLLNIEIAKFRLFNFLTVNFGL